MTLVLTRATKQAARYTDVGGRERCSGCRFFMPQGTCGRIIGPVSPRGWCKYYSQEAVQKWQPGVVPAQGGPSLALNLMNPGALPPGITFTRASTGTYSDNTGTVQTAAVNAPRWDYAAGVLRGLLIEEARQNILLQSANAANAAWIPNGITVAAPTVTANQSVSPDGTTTAARLVYPAVSAVGNASEIYQSLTVAAAQYSFSVWLRGAVGGEQLYLSTTPDTATWYRQAVTLTTAWQRFTLTTSALTAGAWLFFIGTDRRDVSQNATPAQTIYVWGGQVEQGSFATSYVPTTTAAVTRATDVATMPTASWFSASAGTIQAEFLTANIPAAINAGIIRLDDATSNNAALVYAAAGGPIYALAVVATVTQLNIASATNVNGTPQKAAIAYGGGLWSSAIAGTVFAGTGSTIPIPATRIALGTANADPTIWKLNGYLRAVNYWPRALSNTEMTTVTT